MLFEVALGVFLVALGFAINELRHNWGRVTGRLPLDVFVEPDPAVFLAGEPNWDGFEYVLPMTSTSQVREPPTPVCREWHRWATGRNGVPADEQRVQIILIPRGDATVLVEALEPEVVAVEAAMEGIHVACPVGGADAIVRHIELDFAVGETPFTCYREAGEGEVVKPFKFTIGAGDAERFEVHAKAGPDVMVSWRARLHLVADGRKHTKTIDNEGRPFRLTGTGNAESFVWMNGEWKEYAG